MCENRPWHRTRGIRSRQGETPPPSRGKERVATEGPATVSVQSGKGLVSGCGNADVTASIAYRFCVEFRPCCAADENKRDQGTAGLSTKAYSNAKSEKCKGYTYKSEETRKKKIGLEARVCNETVRASD